MNFMLRTFVTGPDHDTRLAFAPPSKGKLDKPSSTTSYKPVNNHHHGDSSRTKCASASCDNNTAGMTVGTAELTEMIDAFDYTRDYCGAANGAGGGGGRAFMEASYRSHNSAFTIEGIDIDIETTQARTPAGEMRRARRQSMTCVPISRNEIDGLRASVSANKTTVSSPPKRREEDLMLVDFGETTRRPASSHSRVQETPRRANRRRTVAYC